jgi:hypothetical protein
MRIRCLIIIPWLVLISDTSVFAQQNCPNLGNRIDPEALKNLNRQQVEWLRIHRPAKIFMIRPDSTGDKDTSLVATFEYPGTHVRVTNYYVETQGGSTIQEYDERDTMFLERVADSNGHIYAINKYDSLRRRISSEIEGGYLSERFTYYIDEPHLTRIIDDQGTSADTSIQYRGINGRIDSEGIIVRWIKKKKEYVDSSCTTFYYYDHDNNLVCKHDGNLIDSFYYYPNGVIAHSMVYSRIYHHKHVLLDKLDFDTHGNWITTNYSFHRHYYPGRFKNEYDSFGRLISIAVPSDSSIKRFYWNDDDSFAGWDSFIDGKLRTLNGATVPSEHYVYKF